MNQKTLSTANKIYILVSQIPKGKVMTYGQIARIVGCGPRFVGYVMHHNHDPKNIPCHRVVNSQGKVAKTFAFGGEDEQQKRLEKERISFINGKLSLKEVLWDGIIDST